MNLNNKLEDNDSGNIEGNIFNKKTIKTILICFYAVVAFIGILIVASYGNKYREEKALENKGYISTEIKILDVKEEIVRIGASESKKKTRTKYIVSYQYADPEGKVYDKSDDNIIDSSQMETGAIMNGWLNPNDYEDLTIEYGSKYYVSSGAKGLIMLMIFAIVGTFSILQGRKVKL